MNSCLYRFSPCAKNKRRIVLEGVGEARPYLRQMGGKTISPATSAVSPSANVKLLHNLRYQVHARSEPNSVLREHAPNVTI